MNVTLKPSLEIVGVNTRYDWDYPSERVRQKSDKFKSVWYIALPLSSAHRGSHSGGGALLEGVEGQERYLNEGTVYPHCSLVELVTYHQACFPDLPWKYIDVTHQGVEEVRSMIRNDPPDIVAFSVYTATYIWSLILAAEIKTVNPNAVIIFGNDHATLLRNEILLGEYGRHLVDFIGLSNNGPFTMMGLLHVLHGQLDLARVPSVAYRKNGRVISQEAPTYPLNLRMLPDYRLIKGYLEKHYDHAFKTWYSNHYELKRMVTLPLDGGCQWGKNPKRRCKHCSIQGLTPKMADMDTIISTLEITVGDLQSNVYAAGDSTLGFSENQWKGEFSYLNELAQRCANSEVLSKQRFMLTYGLVAEFLKSAELCKGFVRTWNVGLEAFNPKLLKQDSKGINRGIELIYEALELAKKLDYKLYISGILGLPGTTLDAMKEEVDNWLALTETYQENITTVSVALPAVIPGSRMYWESYNHIPEVKKLHGEIISSRRLSELYIKHNSEVEIEDVEAAIAELGQGVLEIANRGGNPVKFGGYMMGGVDDAETKEKRLLNSIMAGL